MGQQQEAPLLLPGVTPHSSLGLSSGEKGELDAGHEIDTECLLGRSGVGSREEGQGQSKAALAADKEQILRWPKLNYSRPEDGRKRLERLIS